MGILFLFILTFCSDKLTSGQVLPLYSTPRKTVTMNSGRGHVFREQGVWNYTTMLLREDLGVLILGARETIFALDLMDITRKKAMVKWTVPASMQETCSSKGKTPTECKNYIRILHKMPNGTMYVCGTNAFNPTCDHLTYTDANLNLENKQQDGKGKCPFDPFQRYASELVDGELYAGTSLNFLGTELAVMRSINVTVRTESMSSSLNDPNFVSLVHIPEGNENPEGDDDKIYVFFSEIAVEYDTYNKLAVSRVARVCKGDVGGKLTLHKRWTSFVKAPLDCSVLHNRVPLLIQHVFLYCPDNWKTCVFYGVFTPQTDMPQYSAVCTYNIEDIRKVFSLGQFKTLYSDTSMWVYKWIRHNGPLPDPRPGACINNEARQKGFSTSLDLPDKTLQFIRDNPLMDQAVKQSSEQPVLVKKGAAFTRIVVVNTTALDGSSHRVMFIGTASGSVLKAVNYNGKMVIIEEVQMFSQSEPVKILHISTTLGQLYVGSEVAVVQMSLSACGHYTSCMDCVLARDPYCGWDLTSDRCIAVNKIHPHTHRKVVQSLRNGNAKFCPAVESTTTIKSFFPSNMIRLPCQPGSNLARVRWRMNERTIKNSKKYHIQHNSLLILDALDTDAGFYTCTSVESSNGEDYVTLIAMYDLRLGNFIKHPSVLQKVLILAALIIVLTLMLLSLVVWNICRGHFAILKCSCKAGGRVSVNE